MNLKTIPKKDRTVFHEDPRVNHIVELLLIDESSSYKEIIYLINNIYNFNKFEKQIHSLIVLNDLSDLFWKYIPHLWNIYNDNKNCSNLRGALLERFVFKLLEGKYSMDCDSDVSCFICIESWKSSKSVDVFFITNEEDVGDSFECKVNPNYIEEEHINNLKQIFIKSNKKVYPNIASFSAQKSLELKLKEFKNSHGIIKLFGSEKLKEIATPIIC